LLSDIESNRGTSHRDIHRSLPLVADLSVTAGRGVLVPRCLMCLPATPVQRAPYSLIDHVMHGVPVRERLVTPKPRTSARMPMPEAKRRRMV
jgi:hypothetical protein